MEFSDDVLKATASQQPIDPGREIGGYRLVDADTMVRLKDDKKFRASNLSAPETAHIKSGIFVPGQIGGEETFAGVSDIVEQMGVTPVGEPTGAKSYKREMAPFTAADIAYRTGTVRPDRYTSPEMVKAATEGYIGRTLLPGFAADDPYQKIGQKTRAAIAQAAAKENVPLYVSPYEFRNEAERAAYNQYRSNQAINEDSKLIDQYQKELDSGEWDSDNEKEFQRKINILRAQTFSRAMRPDIAADMVTYRSSGDRTLDNQARDQMTTSWDRTWSELGTGIIDLGKAVGQKAGWEALERNADAWSWNRKYDTNKMAATISSYKDVTQAKGFWDTTSTAMTYLGNLASQTAVYMVSSLPGMAVGGASIPLAGLAGFAVGASPMFLSTAGEIYEAQPDKNKNLGMALATSAVVSSLEQLGFKFLLRGSTGLLKPNVADVFMTKEGRNAMADYMVNTLKKASTREEALSMIENATKRGLTNFAQNAAEFASQQNTIMKNIARVGGKTLGGAAGEGLTELAQEATQIYGETGDWGAMRNVLDPQYRERLKEAAIGGAALGGPIGTVRGANSAMQWWGVEDYHKPADPRHQADYVKFQGMQRAKEGTAEGHQHTSVDQALSNYQGSKVSNEFDGVKLGDTKLSSIYGDKQGSWLTRAKEIVKDPLSFFRGQAGSIIRSAYNDDGSLRLHMNSLWSMISDKGFLSGAHEERHEKDLRARWSHGLNLGNLAGELGVDEKTAAALIKDTINNGVDENTHPAILNWLANAERARRDMYYESVDNGVNPNQLHDLETMLNVIAARQDRDGAVQRDAQAIADELSTEAGNAPITNRAGKVLNTQNNILKLLKDLASKDRTVSSAAAEDLRDLGALNSPTFVKATDYNIVDNLKTFIHNKAKEISLQRFYGKDGEKMGKIILHAYHEGEITADQAREAAYMVDRMLQQRKGEYYDMSDYKTLDTMMSLSTSAMLGALLGKVALTSQVEVAMASLGIPQDKFSQYMSQYLGALKDNLKEDLNWVKVVSGARLGLQIARKTATSEHLAKCEEAMNIIDNAGQYTPEQVEKAVSLLNGLQQKAQPRQLAEALGFLHSSSAFNQQMESNVKSKISDINRKMMGLFQLTNVTDATRIAVLAALPDMIREKLSTLSMIPPDVRRQMLISGRGLTKEQAEAYRELTQFGLDVFGHLQYIEENKNTPMDYSDLINEEVMGTDGDAPSPRELLRRNMMTTLANIVNKHVVEPEVQNTPIGFGSPWLRPLTTLKRFVWASYNTFIPRLYKDFIKDGNVAMRYDAFVTMAMMYMMSSLTNSLKDMISWGDSEKHDKKLGFYRKIQRNIYSSGLLGQVGPAAETFMPVFGDPLYGVFKTDKKGQTAAQLAHSVLKEHSPMYGYLSGPVQAGVELAEGKPDKAARDILRATPLNISPGMINKIVNTIK